MRFGVFQLDADGRVNGPAKCRRDAIAPRVVLGKIYPNQCVLFGKACTPRNPVGPCMVSDEGACRIWWSSGIRQTADEPASARY